MRSLSLLVSQPLTRPVSRRTAQGLLAGVVALALGGCDLLPRATPSASPEPSADEALVDSVATSIRAAAAVAATTPTGRSLVDVHAAHLAALGTAPAATTSPAPAPVADLRATESALQATLTEAAGRALDGGLARMLASMAASIAQQLAVLPGHQGAAR